MHKIVYCIIVELCLGTKPVYWPTQCKPNVFNIRCHYCKSVSSLMTGVFNAHVYIASCFSKINQTMIIVKKPLVLQCFRGVCRISLWFTVISNLFLFQFNDYEFPSLSGGRIVRIATHPDYQSVSLQLYVSWLYILLSFYVLVKLFIMECFMKRSSLFAHQKQRSER